MNVDLATLATVTVTFNPDIELLTAQLEAMPNEVAKVVVDNASSPAISSMTADLVGRFANSYFIRNETNLGLAAAINRGVSAISHAAPLVRYVLLLDQDSEPLPSGISKLMKAYRELEEANHKVGCVGPALLDPDTHLKHGFHQCTRWRWKRVYPEDGSSDLVPCANLNGSGTLVSVELFQSLGGMDERLFIDHVDTDWAFRVLASGHKLWGVPDAVFVHRMGQNSVRFWWFGWRIWPSRSPQRHYFLFRNAVLLMRRSYVPRVWKFWVVIKLAITAFVTSVLGPSRITQLANMWRGVLDALSFA